MCAQRCHDSTHILLVYLYFQFNCLQMLKHSYFHTRLFVTTVAIKIVEELSELTSLKKYMLLCTKSVSSCSPDCIWHMGLRYVVSASEIRNIYIHIKSKLLCTVILVVLSLPLNWWLLLQRLVHPSASSLMFPFFPFVLFPFQRGKHIFRKKEHLDA